MVDEFLKLVLMVKIVLNFRALLFLMLYFYFGFILVNFTA